MEQPVHLTSPANALISTTVSELYPLVLAQMREFAVVLLDTEGVITWFSPSAEELFGHKLEHIVSKKADLLFTAEDLARGVFQHEMATASAQGSMEDDRWMSRADGSRFWANGVMFPLYGTGKTLVGFCKMLRDRTDLKQQLSTLRNEIHALIERGKQKDTVLALVAHEMRNPLFATSVAVDTIRRSVPSAPQQPFDVIDRQLGTMRRLLEDVTDAAQAVTGRLKLKRERLDLRQVILRALETMRPAIRSRRHIVNEILLPVSIPVDGDPDRLQQVLRNLVDNAVKYTPLAASSASKPR